MDAVITELELATSEMTPSSTASEVIEACRRHDADANDLSENEIAHALLLNQELLAACVEWARR